MKFIGRQAELSKLNAEYTRDGSFVVIYGRRRVGKTTLIKEFLKKKTAFYFLATEELESQSMKRLAGVIARTTKNALLQKATFTDWLDLFQVIADYKPEEKKVLVIDEFPYLVKNKFGVSLYPAKCLGRNSERQQCDADSVWLPDRHDEEACFIV